MILIVIAAPILVLMIISRRFLSTYKEKEY
jgi:hypothetical protein